MKGSDWKLQSPGMKAWVSLSPDSDRTVVIAIKRISDEMIRQGGIRGDEGFKIFWHAELLGRIVCWKQGTENTVESAFEYESNVADLYGPIWVSWAWPP